MKWSWKIGEFLGIGLYMHATFPLLLAFVAFPALFYDGDIVGAAESIGFILVLFVCVVLHEYGHALAARRYGIQTQDITLLPIGGVARLERMPEKPSQELVVAAAGPMVNLAIAVVLGVVMLLAGTTMPWTGLGWGNESFIEQLFTVNVVLILFNLIPAFPMDGGRILRALLATKLDYARATQYAARLGQGIAIVFGIAGFFINPVLVLTAIFIFVGAQGETQMARVRSKLAGMTAGQAMRTNIRAVAPTERVSQAVNVVLATGQQDLPVVENGRVVGMLTREALVKALTQLGSYVPVSAAMESDVTTVEADQGLATASETMQAHGLASLPVTQNGMLVGLLTFDGIREFVRLRTAMNPRGTKQPQNATL